MKLVKINDDTFAIKIDGEPDYVDTLQSCVLHIGQYVSEYDIQQALWSMGKRNHNMAEFGIHRTFIYSAYEEEIDA